MPGGSSTQPLDTDTGKRSFRTARRTAAAAWRSAGLSARSRSRPLPRAVWSKATSVSLAVERPHRPAPTQALLAAEEQERRRRAVLLVDAAHLLSPEQLEGLRQLTNAVIWTVMVKIAGLVPSSQNWHSLCEHRVLCVEA